MTSIRRNCFDQREVLPRATPDPTLGARLSATWRRFTVT